MASALRGSGAEPLVEPRGQAPGQGVRGRSPPEAEQLLEFVRIRSTTSESELGSRRYLWLQPGKQRRRWVTELTVHH